MNWNSLGSPESLTMLIPIVAILGGLTIAGIAIVTDYLRRKSILEMHHKERMLAIERGMEPPAFPAEANRDEFLEGVKGAVRGARYVRSRYLRSGLVLLFVGIALFIALALNRSLEVATWALIPIAVGIGNLAFHYLGMGGNIANNQAESKMMNNIK